DYDTVHNQTFVYVIGGNFHYSAGYNPNMTPGFYTDTFGTQILSYGYGDQGNPDHPTQVTDANGHISLFSWDPFGNPVTVTRPRGITTTYTWDYTQFPLGELLQAQEGSKTPTKLAYYEPTGLIQAIYTPVPGTSSANTWVQSTFNY